MASAIKKNNHLFVVVNSRPNRLASSLFSPTLTLESRTTSQQQRPLGRTEAPRKLGEAARMRDSSSALFFIFPPDPTQNPADLSPAFVAVRHCGETARVSVLAFTGVAAKCILRQAFKKARKHWGKLEAGVGIEPTHRSFAECWRRLFTFIDVYQYLRNSLQSRI